MEISDLDILMRRHTAKGSEGQPVRRQPKFKYTLTQVEDYVMPAHEQPGDYDRRPPANHPAGTNVSTDCWDKPAEERHEGGPVPGGL